jgi:hypothetical protein
MIVLCRKEGTTKRIRLIQKVLSYDLYTTAPHMATVSCHPGLNNGAYNCMLVILPMVTTRGVKLYCMRHFHNDNTLNPVILILSSLLCSLSIPNSP